MKNNKIPLAEGGVEEQGGLSSNIIFSGRDSTDLCPDLSCLTTSLVGLVVA